MFTEKVLLSVILLTSLKSLYIISLGPVIENVVFKKYRTHLLQSDRPAK